MYLRQRPIIVLVTHVLLFVDAVAPSDSARRDFYTKRRIRRQIDTLEPSVDLSRSDSSGVDNSIGSQVASVASGELPLVVTTTSSSITELSTGHQTEQQPAGPSSPPPQEGAAAEPKVAKKKHDRRHAAKKGNNKKRHHRQGRHVCTHEETVSRPVKVVESYCKPAYKSFTQRCANGTLCTAFRVQYDTIYRTTVKYQLVTERKHACCPGWTHASNKHAHGCMQPVCSKGCKHGGTCIKPDVCQCLPGYTGPSCETDIDECSNQQNNKCSQSCLNTPGSYECTCHQGFRLQEDGRSCKFEIESVPELQNLIRNYESMVLRLAQLEKESRERFVAVTDNSAAISIESQTTTAEPNIKVDAVERAEFETTVANMTQRILHLENRTSKLNESVAYLNNTRSLLMESPNDSLSSLSEQVAILEERLADCTCKP